MIKFISDFWNILKGAGIQLDKDEAAALGATGGISISLWAAMQAKHGNMLAHIACLGLFLVQWQHCKDQLANVPMRESNYIRAVILLILFIPIVFIIWLIRILIIKAPVYT